VADTDINDDVLAAHPEGTSLVMVNLLKFRARAGDGKGTGWDAYVRYSEKVAPLIKAHGGDILWAGEAHGAALGPAAEGDWDYVALVRYPDKAAFRAMIASPEYAAANADRLAAVERHVIVAAAEKFGRFREG